MARRCSIWRFQGYRYTRIGNPTNEVLEQRVTQLEGGVAALRVSFRAGRALLRGADAHRGGPQHRLGAAALRHDAYPVCSCAAEVRHTRALRASSDQPEELAALIDENTRAVFCETVGNPAGNVCDLEAMAAVAHAAGVPLIVDNTVPTPILLRPIDFGADIVLHSLTKFLGGHGTTLGGMHHRQRQLSLGSAMRARFPMLTQPDRVLSRPGLYRALRRRRPTSGAARSVFQRTMGAVLSPLSAFLLLQGIETVALRMRAPRRECARASPSSCATIARVASVSYAGFPDSPYYPLVQKYLARARLLAADLRRSAAATMAGCASTMR